VKLSEAKVDALTEEIVRMLQQRDDLQIRLPPTRLRVLVRQTMIDELTVEDRLDEEIRRMLLPYEHEMRRGGVSYNAMFNRIKAKLVRERGLIL
jgi:hypothetical protein